MTYIQDLHDLCTNPVSTVCYSLNVYETEVMNLTSQAKQILNDIGIALHWKETFSSYVFEETVETVKSGM